MKNATQNLIDSMPVLKKYLLGENVDNIEDPVEKTLLNLAYFFENPYENQFQLNEIYLNLEDDWLILALNSISVFFQQDTYLIKEQGHSYIKNDVNYFNQKSFVDFLNENNQNFSEAKMSVYIKRGIIPAPDLIMDNRRYWKETTCREYLNSINK